MRFLVKKTLPSEGSQNQRDLPGAQTSYEVPNGTITGVAVIYLVINVLATLAGNSISTYLGNKPQRDIDMQNSALKQENFKVQMFQRCLELDSNIDREASLELLASTDFFTENESRKLIEFIEKHKSSVPKWKPRNIETLSSYLSNSSLYSPAPNLLPPVQQPNVTGAPTSTTNTPSTGGSTPR